MPKNEQKKARALEALMECDTFTEAAEKAEISRKTLYNYLTEDRDFAQAHRAMQERRAIERADLAEQNYKRAMDTVVELMEDKAVPSAVRLKAAVSMLGITAEEREKTGSLAQKNKERTNPASLAGLLDL